MEELSGSSHDSTTLNCKRPRPSPSASSGGVTGAGDVGGECSSYNSLIEEDEDMDVANCLILLARGGGGVDTANKATRKFTKIPSTSNVKVGIYVYECKTCSRVFPSFQALGGHRASHKKPKLAVESIGHEQEELVMNKVETIITSTINKVHECSICGAEFASGQALGGHMRRHRSSSSLLTGNNKECESMTRNVFVLDLNMPAPLEADDHKPNTTLLTPPFVMVSGAKLVDCHY